jgi:hypothetical protein
MLNLNLWFWDRVTDITWFFTQRHDAAMTRRNNAYLDSKVKYGR